MYTSVFGEILRVLVNQSIRHLKIHSYLGLACFVLLTAACRPAPTTIDPGDQQATEISERAATELSHALTAQAQFTATPNAIPRSRNT